MKAQSLKHLANSITDKVIGRFRAALQEGDEFDVASLRIKYAAWIERVSNYTTADLNEALAAGIAVEIDGEKFLPGDLLIVKEYRNKGIADHLIDVLDKNKSRDIPLAKLFEPSLFPRLRYEQVRQRWLVLGETNRVELGRATSEHWRLYQGIKKKSFEDQRDAWAADQRSLEKGQALFRKTKNASTDDLMQKLGLWHPEETA